MPIFETVFLVAYIIGLGIIHYLTFHDTRIQCICNESISTNLLSSVKYVSFMADMNTAFDT